MSSGSLGSVSGSINLDASQAIAQAEALARALTDVQLASTKQVSFGSGMSSELSQAEAQASRLAASYAAAGAVATTAFIGMAGTIAIGVMNAGNLEQAIANVNAALGGLSDNELESLTRSMQEIGTASQFSATEVANVAEALAKAGFSVEEITNGMAEAVVNLAQATGATLETSVMGVVQAMSIWSEEMVGAENAMTDAADAADILTHAANASSADVQDIITGMRQLGPVAAQMGIGFDEAAAAIAVFTDYGLRGADAGVSLARGLQNLAAPTSDVTSKLGALGLSLNSLGINAYDAQNNFVGFPELFRQLNAGMADLDDKTKLAALSIIFGAEAMDVMGLAIQSGADPLEQLIALMDESGVAAEQSAMRTDTFNGAMQRMAESTGTLLGTLAGGLLGPLSTLADMIAGLAGWINQLPGPIHTTITAAFGLATALTGLAAATLLGSAAWAKYRAAMVLAMGQLAKAALATRAAMVALASNPLVLTLGALVTIGAAVYNSFMKQKKAVEDYNASVTTLENTLETLRRQGDDDLAKLGDSFLKTVDEIDNRMNEWIGGGSFEEVTAWLADMGEPYVEGVTDMVVATERWRAEMGLAKDDMDTLNNLATEALSDPTINAEAWLEWANGLLEGAENAEQLRDAVAEIKARPLSDFRRVTQEGADGLRDMAVAAEEVAGTVADLQGIFDDMDFKLDDLRIEGMDTEADQIAELGQAIEDAFTILNEPPPMEGIGYMNEGLVASTALTKEQMDSLGASWDRLQAKMATGDFDNVAIMTEVLRILGDTDLNAAEKVSAIDEMVGSLHLYTDEMKAVREAEKAWLENGDNFLDFWLQYDSTVNDYRASLDEVVTIQDAFARGLQALSSSNAPLTFREVVQAANDLVKSSRGLDSVLETFNRIDELGSRSSKASSIATDLIGEPGEWATIDQLMEDRIIGIETYNSAVEAGVAIQESDARVQQYLNKIRADQLPVLAAQQEAYEGNIERISRMTVADQTRALALQDQAVQSQLASMYALAYSASLGEIPEEVATSMIVEAAEADPVIKQLLIDFGLIEEGANGEIKVNFPDATSVQSSIEALTESINALIIALDGELPAPDLPAPGPILEVANAYRDLAEAVALANGGAPPTPAQLPPDYVGPVEPDATPNTNTPRQRQPKPQTQQPPPAEFEKPSDNANWDINNPQKNQQPVVTELPNTGSGGDKYRQEVAAMIAETAAWQTIVQGMGTMVPRTFTSMGQGAAAGLLPVTRSFQTAPQTWQAPVTSAITGISSAMGLGMAGLSPVANAGMGAARAAAVLQAAGMNTGVVSEAGLMAGGVATNTATMAGNVISQALGMSTGATGQANSMQTGVTSSAMGMAAGATAGAILMAVGVILGATMATAGIRSAASQWPAIVASMAGAMAAAGTRVGVAGGQGVARGLASQIGAVRAAASAIVNEVERAMNAAGQISSPSKVTTRIGEYLGIGPAVGMDNMVAANEASASNLVDSILSRMAALQNVDTSIPAPYMRPSLFGGPTALAGATPYPTATTGGNTYITISTPVTITGPVYGVEDLDTRIANVSAQTVAPAIANAVTIKRKTQGQVAAP